MKDEYKYGQFPLCFLQELIKDTTKGFGIIISYCIMNFAAKQKYELTEVARQLMYAYYREKDNLLPDKISDLIASDITIDEDYFGFSGANFNPETEISELLEIFQRDSEIRELGIQFYQIRQAAEILNVQIGNIYATQNNYNKGKSILTAFETKYGSDVWTSCKITMLFEFRDNPKDLDLFRAFLAIKSLIGPHNYTATTRNVILMRMLGCKTRESLNEFLKNKTAIEFYQKFARSDKSLRYHFDKLFDSLLNRGFLMSKIFERSVSRKIFLSQKLTYNELANAIIEFHNKRTHKNEEQKAIERIRATI